MREDEVDQSEEEETAEEHLDDDETGGISEPLRNIRLKNERHRYDAYTDFSEISDDEEQNSITIRRLRTAHSDEWLSDEKAEEIIHKVKKVINGKTDIDKKEKADAFEKLQEVVADAQYSLDLAFAAGTLATTKSTARTDAVRYAEKLQDCEYRDTLEGAKRWLKSTIKKINDLETNSHESLEYWIGEDVKTLNNTKEFFKKVKNDMKRSYTLTRAQAENSRVLGARPRETVNTAKAYPSLPADVEETIETRPNRTVSWVQGTKPPVDIKGNKER